ncbi:hypothetical protein DL1_09110 [Thioclava dalianensis]|uniref:Sulfotransferase family protein n=1 Tax=Thioclava dalianensis TaxID=1185766 RepID=A0A074TAP0_9RHOB|nr:sulfotransferase family 2 domain-containing protein [Thioclava dalianensis]KEP68734.1 hypothetical protein DL1_09110 [Thioclava dalianensis]
MGWVDHAKRVHLRLAEASTPTRFVFHHVPKCGGTSVGRALRKRYLLSQATVKPEASFGAFALYTGRQDHAAMLVDVAALREQIMLYHMCDGVRGLSLHVPFSEPAHARFAQHYRFITILRDPVARFVSHFRWSHGRSADHAAISEDLVAFLETDRARRLGASYVEYFAGAPMARELGDPALIARAIANLNTKFDVVGRLDDLGGFIAQIQKVLGVRLRVGHENKARARAGCAILSPELEAQVRAICAPDIAVWESCFGRGAHDD